MRVMVLVKASKDSEAGVMPDPEVFAKMGVYNEELIKAGILLAAEGLHPTSKGIRMRFSGSERAITDGPFAETKELIAGYWIIDVKNIEEAIEWMKRCPDPHSDGGELEIRPFYELSDFAPGEGIRIHEKNEAELKKQK